MELLNVKNLTTYFDSPRQGPVRTLDDLSLTLQEGEILGVVGETGAGKTVLLRTILGLFRPEESVLSGEITYNGDRLPVEDDQAMAQLRGKDLSLILSGQRARLDPVRRIGDQLYDVMSVHTKVSKQDRHSRAISLLKSVGIADAERRLRAFPHELSGGMCQRIVIALGLVNSPKLLMADEPTAGLDVTIQVQILDLFRKMVSDTGAASILATRDLAQAAHYCDRIAVLHEGRLVETATVSEFFASPQQEYSKYLLKAALAARGDVEASSPSVASRSDSEVESPLPVLEVKDLVKHFKVGGHTVHAVNGVSFSIPPGRTLALVGESGSGKTTIGRCIAGLVETTDGSMTLLGEEVSHVSSRKRARNPELETHVVFQEPRESLSPRWTLGTSIEEPLLGVRSLDRQTRAQRVLDLVRLVGLPDETADLYPHQTSAGVQQRIAIARAIAVNPRLVVLDEPTSALDSSVKSQVIELLVRLQEELGIAYLFISHDMTAVKMIAHEIAILYLGQVFESGPADEIFERQINPYGRALMSSVLHPDPLLKEARFRLEGEIPSAIDLPTGCALSTRCPLVQTACVESRPPLETLPDSERKSACARNEEILLAGGPDTLQVRTVSVGGTT